MRTEKGFTLIELLVVIAIIGILAAIAIPQFASYRQRGFNARAQSDLRNLATGEEAYFADFEVYTSTLSTVPGFQLSAGVTMAAPTISGSTFTTTARHAQGNKTYTWNNANKGLQP